MGGGKNFSESKFCWGMPFAYCIGVGGLGGVGGRGQLDMGGNFVINQSLLLLLLKFILSAFHILRVFRYFHV